MLVDARVDCTPRRVISHRNPRAVSIPSAEREREELTARRIDVLRADRHVRDTRDDANRKVRGDTVAFNVQNTAAGTRIRPQHSARIDARDLTHTAVRRGRTSPDVPGAARVAERVTGCIH
ncbi:MAG: hypothetical protein M3N49_00235, partial [Candidatus Eremiobacteraeota bacterium]|nr:hypothetical protein [Candidatus Eremiobacteraeota bacterium]